MKERTKMRLKARVEELEKKFNEKIDKMQKTIDFITEYDKDAIRFMSDYESHYVSLWSQYPDSEYYLCAEYIKNGELYKTKVKTPYYVENEDISIFEKIDYDTYIIKCKTYQNKKLVNKYLQLTKSSGEIIDITEIKERFENQEKVSENLKSSAESLGNIFKDLFASEPAKKCKKGAKSSAEKCKKCGESAKTTKKTSKKENK